MGRTASVSGQITAPFAANGWADDYSGWGNHVLYQMCREAPGHKNIDVVQSKLWLIGRSYAAALERGAGKGFDVEAAAWRIVASKFDDALAETASISRPTGDNLPRILQTHARFVQLLAESLPPDCKRKRRPSLASKYLHFHQPRAFFLYDSISAKAVGQRLRDLNLLGPERPTQIKASDPGFAKFAARMIRFRNLVVEPELRGMLATPRRLDMLLQRYAQRAAAYDEAFLRDPISCPSSSEIDKLAAPAADLIVRRPTKSEL